MKKTLWIASMLVLLGSAAVHAETAQEIALADHCGWIAQQGAWGWMPKANQADPQWSTLRTKILDAYVYGDKDKMWQELFNVSTGCIFPLLRKKMGINSYTFGNLDTQVNKARYPKISDLYIWLNQINGNQVPGQGNLMSLADFNNNFYAKLSDASDEYKEILQDICSCMRIKIYRRSPSRATHLNEQENKMYQG